MPTFTTAFSQPPAVGSIDAAPDTSRSAVLVTWTSSGIAAAEFYQYRVLRRIRGTTDWTEAGAVLDVAGLTFTDIAAPHMVDLEYSVRVDNGWAESDDVIDFCALSIDGYWIVGLDDPALTFALPHVQAYSYSEDADQEDFRPVGRSAPLVVEGERYPPKGQMQMLVTPGDRAMVPLLRRAAAVAPFVLLKDPFGEVLSVKLGGIGTDRGQAGNRVVSTTFTAVEA